MSYSVLIADPIDKKAQQMLVAAGFNVTASGEPTPEEVMKLLPEFDVLIVRSRTKVTKEMIAVGKNLKVIGRAGVGVDTIDMAEAEKKGIKVINAPGSNSRSVAEHTIGLMFALARQIAQADASMKRGLWEKKLYKGIELEGKTLGIIGFGHVGKIVAQLAQAIGMKVAIWSRSCSSSSNNEYTVNDDLHELLAHADFISVHVPKTKETEYLINAQAFEAMKDGVYLVHTARGGIVHEQDLLHALESGKVAGAALDVFEHEPTPDPSLVSHANVIATPHIAANTQEAQQRAGVMVAEQIIHWAHSL